MVGCESGTVMRWVEILIHGWSMVSWYWFDLKYERGEISGSCFSGRDVIPWPLLVGVYGGAPSIWSEVRTPRNNQGDGGSAA
ncbi:hypothetical protein DEO72_LG11g2032 [Vigna unguiculata]|uniref:Uncharacterized protein n=1 Tax=Vigna unguiculata TaxID=3917 RepID=A0A4D6NQT0_VIGUN|nr:hypothetical protein DEO72_LG11g2032 [Vigna unguiculata]